MSAFIYGNKVFFNGEFLSRMEKGKVVHVCDVPTGSKVRQVASADPLVQKFVITHPKHPPKMIEIGPDGILSTTNEIDLGYTKSTEDLMLYGINITLDGERIDPMEFFVPGKQNESK